MSARRNERPVRRVNPSGKVVFVARYTGQDGKRRSAGTYSLRRDAQQAIWDAYEQDERATAEIETVGGYADRWLDRHPRSDRTHEAYRARLAAVLDVELRRRPFRDWQLDEVQPREVVTIVDVLLREQGRAVSGTKAIVTTLSGMWRDAIQDGLANTNPFRDVKVRNNDPRAQKGPRKVRLYTWEQMHKVAAHARGTYGPAMIRVLSDCGLRLGEMLPLERGDLRLNGCTDLDCRGGDVPHLHVQRTAHYGTVTPGTKTSRGTAKDGRVAPVPAGLAELLQQLPPRLDTRLLFPTRRGTVMHENVFRVRVWHPACEAAGLEGAIPHEFRHAWVSYMRAALVDVADLADAAGHSVQTASSVYTHSLGQSFEAMRGAVGE